MRVEAEDGPQEPSAPSLDLRPVCRRVFAPTNHGLSECGLSLVKIAQTFSGDGPASAGRSLERPGSFLRTHRVVKGLAVAQKLFNLAQEFSSTSATHATYRVQVDEDPTRHQIFALDLATGERSLMLEGSIFGLRTGPDGFHFREQVGDQIHWRSAAPGRPTRTFYSAPADFAADRIYDFHGDHVAYYELVGDSVAVMLKDSPNAALRILTTLGVPAQRDRLRFGKDIGIM